MLFGSNTKTYSQSDLSHITFFPTWGRLYYENNFENIYGETSNIERFFDELKGWSKIYKDGVLVHKRYNAIFVKHFKEAYMKEEQNSKFISLPMSVTVIKFDCDLRPYIHNKNELYKNVLPASITSFTPVLDSDRDVVYISDEADKLLIDFIEEPKYKTVKEDGEYFKVEKDYEEITEADCDEMRQRREMIEEYVPAKMTHWGETWHFMSYPQITSFIVGKDGYIISIDDMTYSGTEYFVPWKGKPVEIYSWIQ